MFIEIYELDPAHFLSAPGLAWQACFKKTKVKLELLTDEDMFLMFEKGIRGGMCQATHRYVKANNKYMMNYDKNTKLSYLEYLDSNNQYGWSMSEKLPVRNFKWIDDISKFNKDFIKNYDENSGIGHPLEVDVEYPINNRIQHSDLAFLPKRKKIDKFTKLVCNVQDKENYVVHTSALKQALKDGLKLTRNSTTCSRRLVKTIY